MSDILSQELKKSCISEQFSVHFKTLSPSACWEFLLYAIGDENRINGGRLREKFLSKYSFLDSGGWWASGLDILTFKESLWGCLKPNSPRLNPEKGKPIKYEHPPGVPTEAFFFGTAEYWQGVIADPKQPIIITEGAKKTASLLSAGFCAVGLPGIFSGLRTPKDEQKQKIGESYLIPQLKAIAQKGREFVFCFDNDSKAKTRFNVQLAVDRTAKLLRSEGCKVKVMDWAGEFPELKGIDDVHYHHGPEALDHLFRNRLSVTAWKRGEKPDPAPAPKPDPTETNRPIEAMTTTELKPYRPQTTQIYGGEKNLSTKQLKEFLEAEGHRLSFDDLECAIYLDGNEKVEVGEDIEFWFLDRFGEVGPKNRIEGGLLYQAKKNSFNPVKKYLEQCRKAAKRVPINNIASRYFGTDDPIYDRMAEMWLIGAVARVFKPGETVDSTLILQGKQGKGKSTFFNVLGGQWFTDSVKDLENKDSLLILHRSWIVELSELDRITSKKQAGVIKHFLTQKVDRFRKPYDRIPVEQPRRAVFCATVNPSGFLTDDEHRRFWPIPIADHIPIIDNLTLAQERDGIWASAVDAYLSGAAWKPTQEEKDRIAAVTKAFEEIDVWHDEVSAYIEDRPWVTVFEILTDGLGREPGSLTRREQMRVARILTQLGWTEEVRREIEGKVRRVKLNPALNQAHYQNISNMVGKVGKVGRQTTGQGFQTYRPSTDPQSRLVNENPPQNNDFPTALPTPLGDASEVGRRETQSGKAIYQPTVTNQHKSQNFLFSPGDFLWWGKGKAPVQVLELPPVGPLTASKSYKCLTDDGEEWIKEVDLHPLK